MTAPASPQAKRNRSAGGRKAAAFVKAQRVRRADFYGPEGAHRGSAPVNFSIGETLARIRASRGGET